MLIVLLLLCFVIVPLTHGNLTGKVEINTNSTSSVLGEVIHNELNDTKITVASEGGAVLSNTPIQSLPKENQAFLITSAAESSSNKVKPRKGAFLEDSKNINSEQNFTSSVNKTINANNGTKNLNVSTNSSLQEGSNKGKPPVVSAEAIAKADLLNNDPAVDDVDEHMVITHKMSSNRHPGMIMPIVITVLVVPMFAVIGYMALKQGREAWKNRHYKRMDFLLDGMYND